MDMRSKTVYISIQNIQEIAHTHASASVFLRLKEGGGFINAGLGSLQLRRAGTC